MNTLYCLCWHTLSLSNMTNGLEVNKAALPLYYLICIERMMWELFDFILLALFTAFLWCKHIIHQRKSHSDPLNANNRDHVWSGLMFTLSNLLTAYTLALSWCVPWMPKRDRNNQWWWYYGSLHLDVFNWQTLSSKV